jgi:parvulin-like peptidyl-prolyl isomerase
MQAKILIEQVQALPEAQQWEVVMAVLNQLQAPKTPQSPGDPMSMKDFQQRIAQAEADVEAGRVYSSDEMRKRVKGWK